MKAHMGAVSREAKIAQARCMCGLRLSLATKGAEAAATAHPADAAADAAETATAPAVEAHAPETGFARGARPTSARSSITMLLIAATNRSRNCCPIYVPRASSRTGVHKLPRPKVTQSAWCALTPATKRML